ncbi:hypothetical protein GCM10007100_09810 [Roseibacillus persicicus]|uniref:Uncharacterized protein n=1 Tax=Roseibacillus persicicus TaxID=454148 RepID=A0A918TG85_9BACT|nr:hypothetical protein GCM10007100_09810 [Roseibacillus persicicus]
MAKTFRKALAKTQDENEQRLSVMVPRIVTFGEAKFDRVLKNLAGWQGAQASRL